MGQALYRKYRSKTFGEVVGQEHVTTTLENALKNQTFAHAYLLTGPRGVGKTSIARIMAYAVNDLPYDETQMHLDIIEIDAASNRRIDEIRDLRDKVHIAPTSAKYKVYIIDEVHMLTKEAFNALLKTLEEPPAHVIFILATTEVHKLPETIISRTQHFRLRTISTEEVAKSLQKIAEQEGVKLSGPAATLVADYGNGSFRDSISLLDQLRSASNDIDEKTVQQALGVAPNEIVERVWQLVLNGSPSELIDYLASCHANGFEANQITKQLIDMLKAEIINNGTKNVYLETIKELLGVSSSSHPESLLEISLLKAQLSLGNPSTTPVPKTTPTPPSTTKTPEPVTPVKHEPPEEPVVHVEEKPEEVITTPEERPVEETVVNTSDDFTGTVWPEILAAIKKQHNTLYSVVRMAQPSLQGNKLVLVLSFPFHLKRLSESKNSQTIVEIAEQITGKKLSLVCELAGKEEKQKAAPTSKHLDTVSNIFGGAEVLES